MYLDSLLSMLNKDAWCKVIGTDGNWEVGSALDLYEYFEGSSVKVIKKDINKECVRIWVNDEV